MIIKDTEWLKAEVRKRIDKLPTTYIGMYTVGSRDAYDLVLQDIDQLDEPEVLSQEWIDKNKTSTDRKLDGTPIYKVREELLQNLLVPKEELPLEEELTMSKLETLVVPTDLGEWLQSRRIGDSGVYFSMIDSLYHYWENVLSSSTDSFITDNKKELIEVILGNREYEVEEPLYHALIKGHEVSNSCDIYWNYDKYDNDVFVSRLYPSHDNFLTEMSKLEWNGLGINDSNADFIRV